MSQDGPAHQLSQALGQQCVAASLMTTDPDAHFDARPQMEILTDHKPCRHLHVPIPFLQTPLCFAPKNQITARKSIKMPVLGACKLMC